MHPSRTALIDNTVTTFRRTFGDPPALVVSTPGRVNLIGEHTDYNDGFVLPACINRSIVLAARQRSDKVLVIHFESLEMTAQVSLDELRLQVGQTPTNHVAGVAAMLQQQGRTIRGADVCICSDLPQGAGLASSAALEISAAFAFRSLNGLPLTNLDLVLLAYQTEHEFVGVQCGIMDQYVTALAMESSAMVIDCRSLESSHVPFPDGYTLLVCHSGVNRELAKSEYNLRRQQCNEIVALLSSALPNLHSLRDLSTTEFRHNRKLLPPLLQERCQHVVSENARVLEAVEALRRGDLPTLGKVMYESHMSLKDCYDVSCPELDAIVDICAESEGVIGARMTGAGFGGSVLCLVEDQQAQEVSDRLAREYPKKTGLTPLVLPCAVEGGAFVKAFT
jgi:galactokinase